MYQLYYSPGACSMAVHVVLNELNVPFELKRTSLSEGQNCTPEFLALNPRGQVPVLVDDGQPIREGAAILLHLFSKHPNSLLPEKGFERTKALEWLMFANATLHPAYSRVFFLLKNAKDETEKEALLTKTYDLINQHWQEIEKALTDFPYLCGNTCTAADILVTVIANWSARMGDRIILGSRARKLFSTIIERPSYQKALAAEQVEYKVAA